MDQARTTEARAHTKPARPAWVRRIRSRLLELGWSIPKLAQEMGDPDLTDRLYKILDGKVENPRGNIVSEISRAIGIPHHEIRYGLSQGREDPSPPRRGVVELDVRAGLGAGGTMADRDVIVDGRYADPVKDEPWTFPSRFVREELRAAEPNLRVIETQGDSMAPTILSGDRVIVDAGHRVPSPDGIYALRDQFDLIVVKRLQALRTTPPRLRIISDNQTHEAEEVGLDDVSIVGRVLWALKRL